MRRSLIAYRLATVLWGVLFVAALLFAIRPSFAKRLPLVLRLGTGAAAMLWMRTGLACTPRLMNLLETSIWKGGFAWFHMSAQHVFLALCVLAFSVAPHFLASRMGFGADRGEAEAPATVPAADRA